ncbi:hypothetical protein A1O7_05344 [Cladophialophora yegresii CBS 114405]|uniref:Major facilitator superfamily (MFS) profile domain-containing protein n=1 Tax=Cladophialophora yegresii CBS 114405 TaxID=1182544 RepID=W9W093_9EURO|nr:uncharacterized protein A1O7_05344 [Cladophialophora yegresii CBS 114405]EXJ57921.1 hypothetical protein A1O7_05344 [Cladophialophora yegresii CBS 114405]
MGSVIAGIAFAKAPDWIGRKWALFVGAVVTIVGVVLQTAAQNNAMFVIARIIIGFGTGASSIAAPVYLSETVPDKLRALSLVLLYDSWYVGDLIAAGITYGSAKMDSTRAWRLPSALLGLFSLLCIILIPFPPESPRWLQNQGRSQEALLALARTHSNGSIDDPAVTVQFRQITDTLAFENSSTPHRIFLVCTVAVFAMLSGNNIISYYFGTMLTQAGATDPTTQLEINIILSAWCLVIPLVGTAMADKLGLKSRAAASTGLLTILIFLVGALTKLYGVSDHSSGIYGTVAAIFLFQGAYSFGWTPLTVLYPPEVLNIGIRSLGMGIYTFLVKGVGLLVTFAFPFALEAIGWKTYMINGAWDVVELVVVLVFSMEIRGRTLEEIDENLDGEVHSAAPPLQAILDVAPEERAEVVGALELRKDKDFVVREVMEE